MLVGSNGDVIEDYNLKMSYFSFFMIVWMMTSQGKKRGKFKI